MIGPELAFRLLRLPMTSETCDIRDEEEFRGTGILWAAVDPTVPFVSEFERGLARAHLSMRTGRADEASRHLQQLQALVANEPVLRDAYMLACAEVGFGLGQYGDAIRVLESRQGEREVGSDWAKETCWLIEAYARVGRRTDGRRLRARLLKHVEGLAGEERAMTVIMIAYFFSWAGKLEEVAAFLEHVERAALEEVGVTMEDVLSAVQLLAIQNVDRARVLKFVQDWNAGGVNGDSE